MDVLSLVIFLGVILIAFVRKINVGILALAAGVFTVRLLGMKDSDLVSGLSSSMFATLVGITLLFAVVNSTGALDLLARKIVAMSGNKVWLIPVSMFISGFVIAGVGPGAIPALAIIPAIGVSVALEVGYNPVMVALVGEAGLMAGRMTPITPEAAVILGAAAGTGVENVMTIVLVCQTLTTIVFAIVVFFIFKGHKLKAPVNPISSNVEPFTQKHLIALSSILGMMALMIFFNVNIGLAAFLMAALLTLFGIGDDAKSIKAQPWTTIVMILGVGALLTIVDKAGGVKLMSDALSKVMTRGTAIPIMGVSAGLLSIVSSALAVVYPTMMPLCTAIAEQVGGGLNPAALMAAVGVGGSLAGVSPLSTGGALILAALGTAKKDFSKEEQNKVFGQLLLMSVIGLVVIVFVSAISFDILANILA